MSNRILGILILIGFIGVFFTFYLYFFKYNRVNIELSSNLANYEVELYNKDLKTTFNKKCEEKVCIFKNFSAFNYKIIVRKPGYRNFKYSLNIRETGLKKVVIKLEKDIFLRAIKKKEVENILRKSKKTGEKKILSEKEKKIKELRNRKTIIKSIFIDSLGNFIFKKYLKDKNKLELLYNETSLGLFDKPKNDKLDIKNIFYTNSFIFINIGEKKYIYNLISKNFFILDINLEINYIKIGKNNNEFKIITDKGTFKYNSLNKDLQYEVLFKDFEIIGDNYIGVIFPEETEKFKNYGYQNLNFEKFIIKYNIKTSKKEVLYKTKMSIKKIFKIKGENGEEKIIIYNKAGDSYELVNF